MPHGQPDTESSEEEGQTTDSDSDSSDTESSDDSNKWSYMDEKDESEDLWTPPPRLKKELEDELRRQREKRRRVQRYNLRQRQEPMGSNELGSLIFDVIQSSAENPCMPPEEERQRKRQKKPLPPPPFPIKSLPDLIKLATLSKTQAFKDCEDLPKLIQPLKEIQRLIGLTDVKTALVRMVIMHCQRHKLPKSKMNHVVITGPSGCGKTTLARCMAKLFNKMGEIKTDKVVEGNRQNMIASYLGQTAKKTQAVIDRAIGGTLLIDEAYSLGDGSSQGTDSYSKACIDTLNQNLSERGDQFKCIIVGYKESLRRDFFNVNEGLERRFPLRFHVQKYTPDELSLVFDKMLQEQDLKLGENAAPGSWFATRMEGFPHFCGSVQNFVTKVKASHSMRVFGLPDVEKCIISREDCDRAYVEHMAVVREGRDTKPPESMYM